MSRVGVKRARASSSDVIPKFLGTPELKDSDPIEVREMLEFTAINIDAWLASLPLKQITGLVGTVDKYESSGLSDTSIKAFGDFINEMGNLKEAGERISQAKMWGYSLMKAALENYCDSEGKNKRASKSHKAVRYNQGRAFTNGVDI